MSRSRVILIVFAVTAFLIATISLRTSASRMYFQYRRAAVEQEELLRELRQKQLQFECLINPAGLPHTELTPEPPEDTDE